MLGPEWKKSQRSGQSGQCVEARLTPDGHVEVRDSKDPDGAVLRFTPEEWVAFVGGVRDGDFDIAA